MNTQIFVTLTSGRSGTGKLCSVLSGIPDMVAEHEGEPCYSTVLHANISDPAIGRQFVVDKLRYIERLGCRYYCDTSFVICEGFVEHFLELGVVPSAILLRRDPRLVASSMYALGIVPGRPYHWNELYLPQNPYFLTPSDPDVLGFPNWETAHDYQLCFWFCCEIERRARRYSKMLRQRGARVYEIWTDDLSDHNSVTTMTEHFGLGPVSRVSSERINAKDELKDSVMPDDDTLRAYEQHVLDCTNRFDAPGARALPHTNLRVAVEPSGL